MPLVERTPCAWKYVLPTLGRKIDTFRSAIEASQGRIVDLDARSMGKLWKILCTWHGEKQRLWLRTRSKGFYLLFTHAIFCWYLFINHCQPVSVRFSHPRSGTRLTWNQHWTNSYGRGLHVNIKSYVSVLPYRRDFGPGIKLETTQRFWRFARFLNIIADTHKATIWKFNFPFWLRTWFFLL